MNRVMLLGFAALLCVPGGVLAAQDAIADSGAAKPQMMAKEADPGWDVVTVKPSDPNDPNGQHINLRGRHVLMTDTTVEQFLLLGYNLQKSQLADEPT